MRKFLYWLHGLFSGHKHDKKLFCVGEIAFVKCTTCGHESIPWKVKPETAKEWHRTHPDAMKELLALEKTP
jgi:hypothetical protein